MPEPKTLAELNKEQILRAQTDRRLAFTTYPELLYPIWLKPCKAKILMVTDNGGSFGNSDFGLGELLNAQEFERHGKVLEALAKRLQ